LFTSAGQPGDYLQWSKSTNQPTNMRKLEILSVIPDDFDRTYYSIDPDFSYNYLDKIKNANVFKNKLPSDFLFHADLGSRMGNNELDHYSIRNQIEDSLKNFPSSQLPDFKNKLTYLKDTFGSLLTSWQVNNNEDYSTLSAKFGKCDNGDYPLSPAELKDSNKTVPGSCRQGGRVGYSVKLVDGKSLTESNLMLGGLNKSGPILNPPPDPNSF
jgi:hypothetical protein